MAVTDLDPLDIWRRAMVANVRRDAPDLSARQMAVLLTVYMTAQPHTVRGLAEVLNVSKPAITFKRWQYDPMINGLSVRSKTWIYHLNQTV